ncbi:hypothetical protein AAGS61_09450 [Lysinibacillus sp. KU-BSD001]|uniref:hypothetical protein n=1 Tax=Lysinibacillus sp. KU-BSD001 TaxID=3141328 RepID=UPI0036EAB9BB
MARYVLLAKLHSGPHFLFRFDRQEILECLYQFPTTKGLEALAEWPLETHKEMSFFLEMLIKNVKYYHLKDLKTSKKEFVHFDSII